MEFLFKGYDNVFKFCHSPFSSDIKKLNSLVLYKDERLGRGFVKNLIDTKILLDIYTKIFKKNYPSSNTINIFYLKTGTITAE